MSDLWLSADEVATLTGLQPNSYTAQCKRLGRMGIPFTRAGGDGRPLVVREAVCSTKAKPEPKRTQPNWDAISGKAA